jgi:hypothetical protein
VRSSSRCISAAAQQDRLALAGELLAEGYVERVVAVRLGSAFATAEDAAGEVVHDIGELMHAGQIVGIAVCGVGADFQDRLGDEVRGDTALGLPTPTALPPTPHEFRLAIKTATPANRSAAAATHWFVRLPAVCRQSNPARTSRQKR